jgi:gluconolactonase
VYATNVESGETQQIIDDGPVFINGLGFDSGGSTLLVTATLSSELLSYAIAAPDYRPIGTPELLHTFAEGWPDGMAVSTRGDYWVALTAGDRIDVIDTWGRCIGEVGLPPGSLPTNVCFGRRSDELFVTAAHDQALVRIQFDGDELSA